MFYLPHRRSHFRSVVVPTDPYFANVIVLLHFNGANGSTTITDVKGHSFTAAGNAALSTANARYGSAGLLLDGSGDYVASIDSTDWTLGTSDFCFEAWIKLDPAWAAQGSIMNHRPNNSNNAPIWLGVKADKTLRCIAASSTVTTLFDISGTTVLSTGTWYHVAVVRSGSSWVVYLNGASEVTATNSGTLFDNVSGLNIGSDTNTNGFLGAIDDVRFTKGVPRYTTTFSVPSAEFPDA